MADDFEGYGTHEARELRQCREYGLGALGRAAKKLKRKR